jgi:lambda family phage portal protein
MLSQESLATTALLPDLLRGFSMGFIDRVRLAVGAMTGKVVASTRDYRGRTKSGYLVDGNKFSGSNSYPSGATLDNETLREKSRLAYWDSTQARSLIGRLVDNVTGTGLALESRPVWQLLKGVAPLTEDERHTWARDVELRFDLWANSTEPDSAGRWNLYQLQALELLNRLRDGETFFIMRYSGDASRMSPLSLQSILPEQVCTPYDKAPSDAAEAAGRRIVDGIEIDAYGREIAYHISEDELIPGSNTMRVPVSGTERRIAMHPVNADTLGAVRGTPLLAPIIHELKKITDYTVAEIEAAVINAVMAVWVKPGPDAPASRALQGIQTRGAAGTQKSESTESSQTKFDRPGLIIQSLKGGEEVVSFDTKRPNVNFGEFVKQVERGLAASTGQPVSIMNMEATKSYSAIRAEMILFWRKIEIERAKIVTQFLGPVFEAWFSEEVRIGRINAPGFDRKSPVTRAAWLKSAWNGDKLPSIDPLKEAKADSERIDQGVTTRERTAMELNGSDAMENIARLAIENAALAKAKEPLNPVPVVQPQQPDQTDDNDDDNSGVDNDT